MFVFTLNTFQFFNSTENVIIVEVSNVRNVTLRRRKKFNFTWSTLREKCARPTKI